jgi:hypothetical protein
MVTRSNGDGPLVYEQHRHCNRRVQQVAGLCPTHPNTLFNLGIVELHGKKDPKRTTATWKKLLAANRNYPAKDKVNEMRAEAKNGTPAVASE